MHHAAPAERSRTRRTSRRRATPASRAAGSKGSPRPAARARTAGRPACAIEPRDLGLTLVVELFAHPLADLASDLARVDRRAGAPMKREQEVEVREVGLHRRGHVGILQLARQPLALQARRTMHLAERGGRRGLEVEFGEALAPVRARARPACGGARRPRPSAAPAIAASSIRRRNPQGPRRGSSSASARPSSSGPSSSPGRTRAPWRPSAPAAPEPVDADPGGERAGVDAEARVARRPRAEAIGFVVAVQAELLLGTHGI